MDDAPQCDACLARVWDLGCLYVAGRAVWCERCAVVMLPMVNAGRLAKYGISQVSKFFTV